jgi:hypothetical protein
MRNFYLMAKSLNPFIFVIGVRSSGVPRSLVKLIGGSPIRVMISHQPDTESRTAGGNECSEAGRMDVSDRNASEGIEPRKLTRRGSRLI